MSTTTAVSTAASSVVLNNNNNNNQAMTSAAHQPAAAVRLQLLQKQKSAPAPSTTPLPIHSAAKCRHNSNASSRSSTSSSLEETLEHTGSCPNQQQLGHNHRFFLDNQGLAIEMPGTSMRIDLDPFRPASEVHAEPGDIIEIDHIIFSHWVIYVGEGDVVQILGGDSHDVPDGEMATVQRLPLTAVAGDNFCRVNNKLLRAKERNLRPFHNDIVVCKVLSKVGSTVPYNVLQCNSEHYVTEWKYGHRWSDQAQFSLNSFRALRSQHSNSISESHNVFVNTLKEVLDSPAAITSANNNAATASGPQFIPTAAAGTGHGGSNGSSPISLSRLSSICSGGSSNSPTISPKTSIATINDSPMPVQTNNNNNATTSCQTELSLI